MWGWVCVGACGLGELKKSLVRVRGAGVEGWSSGVGEVRSMLISSGGESGEVETMVMEGEEEEEVVKEDEDEEAQEEGEDKVVLLEDEEEEEDPDAMPSFFPLFSLVSFLLLPSPPLFLASFVTFVFFWRGVLGLTPRAAPRGMVTHFPVILGSILGLLRGKYLRARPSTKHTPLYPYSCPKSLPKRVVLTPAAPKCIPRHTTLPSLACECLKNSSTRSLLKMKSRQSPVKRMFSLQKAMKRSRPPYFLG